MRVKKWAKIKGAYVLSRRNVARIIAAISAALLAFHTATAALSSQDEALRRRVLAVMGSAAIIDRTLPPGDSRIAVSDEVFEEFAEMFLLFRHLLHGDASRPCAKRLVPVSAPAVKARTRRQHPGELRQEDVAEVFGVTRQTVARWEALQTEDGPGNTSNPWGYYRSLRLNPELKGAFEILSNQAKSYLSAKVAARKKGVRFRITFVTFRDDWLARNAAKM